MLGQPGARSGAYDYVLVGGGLQNCLLALALAERQPHARVALVERDTRLGRGHTWSFHASDVPGQSWSWLESAVERRWPAYDVHFPRLTRTLGLGYASITDGHLDATLRSVCAQRAGFELILGASATRLDSHEVELTDGRVLTAELVVDARGPAALTADPAGYQKFLGLMLEFERPHRIERPILMDARVEQTDGFRFFYVLPFGPERALFEDTYFSETPTLDPDALRPGVLAYALAGNDAARTLYEESGVLPLPARQRRATLGNPFKAGYAGGFFHPTTGYSFPVAVRLAEYISSRNPASVLAPELDVWMREHARQSRFAEFLNRFLFDGFAPRTRVHVFERFYGLPETSISRFYSLQTTTLDRARILCGRPPRGISIGRLLSGGMQA